MSSDKKRVAVSLSPENVDWLDERYNNRSGFIDDLLTECKDGNGRADAAVRELRIQQLEEEANDMEQEAESLMRKAERKRNQARELREENELVEEQTEVELSEAREALKDTPKDATNPAIKTWAEDLGLTPAELLDELEDGGSE